MLNPSPKSRFILEFSRIKFGHWKIKDVQKIKNLRKRVFIKKIKNLQNVFTSMATGQNHQLRMNASQTQDMQQDQIAINERQQRLNLNQSHNHG